jgi:hypothetical protein
MRSSRAAIAKLCATLKVSAPFDGTLAPPPLTVAASGICQSSGSATMLAPPPPAPLLLPSTRTVVPTGSGAGTSAVEALELQSGRMICVGRPVGSGVGCGVGSGVGPALGAALGALVMESNAVHALECQSRSIGSSLAPRCAPLHHAGVAPPPLASRHEP